MRAVLGFLFGVTVSLLLVTLAGESPLVVLGILYRSAFGTPYDLGLTLFYTTSLIFTGLSVAVAFHAGLFNIGAEGQLTMATITAAAIGISCSFLPFPLAPLVAVLGASLVGFFWGWVPGYLKATRGAHEVINTMMMNFIAAGLSSWLALSIFKNPDSQNPETAAVAPQFMLKAIDFINPLFPDSPANISFVLAILTAAIFYFLLGHHVFGFELRATGQSEEAAQLSGVRTTQMKMTAMGLAGLLASGVAINEVLGSSGKFALGFSADYGFVGIAVALLARNHPLLIVITAFLFGALQKGSADLDLETEFITRDFARVIQAIIIFSVAAFHYADFAKVFKQVKQKLSPKVNKKHPPKVE
jgi:ABC-type uncharacterized transport system permease subunit